jgi:hypothetical protein
LSEHYPGLLLRHPTKMERLNDMQHYSYSWHQSHDQATVLLMVPYEAQEDDVIVIIERNYLLAGVRGQPPTLKVGHSNHSESPAQTYLTPLTGSPLWER